MKTGFGIGIGATALSLSQIQWYPILSYDFPVGFAIVCFVSRITGTRDFFGCGEVFHLGCIHKHAVRMHFSQFLQRYIQYFFTLILI